VQRFEEKNTEQQKVTKVLYSPVWMEEAPTGPIRPKSCIVGDVHDVITCAKFQIEIFMGYDFTRGSNVRFARALTQCSAKRCLRFGAQFAQMHSKLTEVGRCAADHTTKLVHERNVVDEYTLIIRWYESSIAYRLRPTNIGPQCL